MLFSKFTNCLFFCVFCSSVKCLINSVLSRAGTGAVKCRLHCLRAPSNRATIPAHKSWLGLDYCYQEEPFSYRERTDYIEPMLILSIIYFSYLGRSPTLLFAIKKHFLLIDPLPLGWCSCDGPPALLDVGDVLADLLRCRWLLHEYPSVEIFHLGSTWVSIKFPKIFANFSKVR
jgi:hypothetical protein